MCLEHGFLRILNRISWCCETINTVLNLCSLFYVVDECLSVCLSVCVRECNCVLYAMFFCVVILNGCNTTNLYLPYSALLHIQSPSTIFRVPLPPLLVPPVSPSELDMFASVFVPLLFHRWSQEQIIVAYRMRHLESIAIMLSQNIQFSLHKRKNPLVLVWF